MFAINGAPLDEVWGFKPKVVKNKTLKRGNINNTTKMYDDIIDAYIDDFKPAETKRTSNKRVSFKPVIEYYDDTANIAATQRQQEQHTRTTALPPKLQCNTQVSPSLSSDYTEDALEYQRFFQGDHMFPATQQVHNTESNIHDNNEQVNDEASYVHTYDEQSLVHTPQNDDYQQQIIYNDPERVVESGTQTQIIELFLYIISGLLLIVILEQILHLGLYLR